MSSGRFINNDQKIMINSLTTNVKNIIEKNPYYAFSDKKGSIAEYYNINNKRTTLDEATRAHYSDLGPNSPIRFNLIHDAFLYGIPKIDFNFDMGDNGIEASEINGEAVILPNTFIPYPGDYFTLHQIDKPYLFCVNSVDQNTLDTGAVMYKIAWSLQYINKHDIDKQVTEEFNMIVDNVGTNYSAVIESTKYKLIEELEATTTKLKDYYYNIFYNTDVQTFTYLHDRILRVYDAYLIEFMIRNSILKGSTKYINVSHQMTLQNTFSIDYDRTIFSALENKDLDQHSIRVTANLYLVQEKLSLLYAHLEDYYYTKYDSINRHLYPINIVDPELINNIKKNKKYDDNIVYNIIIKFFNNETINSNDLEQIKYIDYRDNKYLFYGIPMMIYCIEQYIISFISKT